MSAHWLFNAGHPVTVWQEDEDGPWSAKSNVFDVHVHGFASEDEAIEDLMPKIAEKALEFEPVDIPWLPETDREWRLKRKLDALEARIAELEAKGEVL